MPRLSFALRAALLTGALALTVPRAQAADPLTSINLPLSMWTVIAQANGTLADAFAKNGIHDIRLVDPGTAQLAGTEAALLDRGGLAIAQRMMYPAAVHKANGIDAEIVWMSGPSTPARTPVLALKSSPIQTVADLKDDTLASSRVGCGWTSPMEVLDTAGVPLDTPMRHGAVRYSDITSTVALTSALLSGRVEAISTHVALPESAGLWLSGQAKVIGRSPDNGVYVNAAGRVSYFAMHGFVEAHPELIATFLRAREQTAVWVADHTDEAAAIVSKGMRLPLQVAKFLIADPSEFEFIEGEHSADNARHAIKIFQAYYIAHGDDILSKHHLADETIDQFVDARFFAGGAYSAYQSGSGQPGTGL